MSNIMTDKADPCGSDPSAELGQPVRAFRLTMALEADTRTDMAWALRNLADRVERDQVTVGVWGGPREGAIYEFLADPTITHDAYHAALRSYLDQKRKPPPEICGNCYAALPEGCGGVFKDDGKHCRLNAP